MSKCIYNLEYCFKRNIPDHGVKELLKQFINGVDCYLELWIVFVFRA